MSVWILTVTILHCCIMLYTLTLLQRLWLSVGELKPLSFWLYLPPTNFLKWFVGTFAKSQKLIISFIMSVSISVCTEKLGFHWMNFYETLYLSIFQTSVKNIQISLKLDRNNRYCTWRPMYIFDHISDKSCRESWNMLFVFNNLFPKIVPFMEWSGKKL